MDATMLPHVLTRIDQVRESQVKIETQNGEILNLLRSPSSVSSLAVVEAPIATTATIGTRIGQLLTTIKDLLAGAKAFIQHIAAVGTGWYLMHTGQFEAALPYVRWLLGL